MIVVDDDQTQPLPPVSSLPYPNAVERTKRKLLGYFFAGLVIGAVLVALIAQVLSTSFPSTVPLSKYPDNWGIHEVYRGTVGYALPSEQAQILLTLPKGTKLRGVGETTTHFDEVSLKGKVVWVLKSAVH